MSKPARRVPSPLVAGLVLTALAAIGGGIVRGPAGAVAAGTFGLVATLIQVAAGRLMAGLEGAPLREFMTRYGAGMGLRMVGILLVGVVIWLDPAGFPPLPAALAYVGVLVPLLFLEARRI